MTQNNSIERYKCPFCEYVTMRNYNLKRHQYNIHNYIFTYYNTYEKIEEENVHPYEENVDPNFICKKCNKYYKIKKNLLIHESKCNGVDDLTCPKCMISFTSRQSKSNHLKRNNCKSRSIIYARKSSLQNRNIENIKNQNNLYINDYGNERLDYLNYDKMLNIFKNFHNIPLLLTKEIHFNKKFPENNNIQYKNETNALIKIDDKFILEDLNILAEELVNEKTSQIQKFALENKEVICSNIETKKYHDIIELLLNFILLKEPKDDYKKQIKKIKDMIKNT